MRGVRHLLLGFIAAMSVAFGGVSDGQTSGPRPLSGRWGGDRVRLDAQATGARLQVECHVATITTPLTPDAEGAFTLKVAFVRFRGVAIEGEERPPTSTVKGRIVKDTLRLTIEPPGAGTSGTFTLTRNSPGKLPNCRMRS